jgi:septum site-determining protein MinC
MSQPAPAYPSDTLLVRHDADVPVLVIPEHMGFDELRCWLREQVPAAAELLGGRTSRIDIGSRPIELFDLRRLVHLLGGELEVEVSGLYASETAIQRFAERELKLKLFKHDIPELIEDSATVIVEQEPADGSPQVGAPPATESPLQLAATERTEQADLAETADVDALESDPEVAEVPSITPAEPGERRTKTLFRTLRSGSIVRFDGDVVVYGDVNPGAHVVASGNIVVLGALQGMVHAGASGDTDAFLLALALHPTQLRIASAIALPPERPASREVAPEIAILRDGAIIIRPYKGRLPT